MKKKSLRVLSLIVAIIMAISILPLAALAEEAGPRRRVGVVVYGSELTAILTNLETEVQRVEEGNINPSATLQSLTELATGLTTKLANGSGISVPKVDVEIEDRAGTKYQLVEDPNIELFTETTETYIPFQNKVETQIETVQAKLNDLLDILSENDPLNIVGNLRSTNGQLDKVTEQLKAISKDLLGTLKDLTGMNGLLYRTYVTPEGKDVLTGDIKVSVKGFYDTDENGNAITRDGYVLYNDGLKDNGSGYNTERYFTTTVKEKGLFDHDIQFVGPANGIAGEIKIPTELSGVYSLAQKAFNSVVTILDKFVKGNEEEDNSNKNFLERIGSAIEDFMRDSTEAVAAALLGEELVDWFKDWNTDVFKLDDFDNLNLGYKFVFPGLWCAESEAGFVFKNVDVAEAGIAGSQFLLVNRQETVDVLKLMLDLGKETLTAILKATFGYTDEETGKQYESMLTLYTQLLKTEDGQISIDYDVAYNIIKNYIAVISDMDLFDKVVETGTDKLGLPKLRYPIPAILMATSDENGLVEFTKNSNKTLTWMLDIIPQVLEAVSKTDLVKENQIRNLLTEVSTYASGLIAEYGEKIINTLVYPFAQRLGLVGEKMGSGKYVMFQIKAAAAEEESYWINPFAYTMIINWTDDWCYVTVADLGIIVPYFAEAWYDFVRNTTFAGTIDSFLSRITGQDVNVVTDILTDKIDVTKEFGKVLTGALTAFVGAIGFDALSLDTVFSSRSDFIAGLNQYLYENGRTAQNLMIYVNKQARKAKAVYAGDLTPVEVTNKDGSVTYDYWQFYNLNKSPTLTATKLIDKSTKDIAAAFVNPTKSGIVSNIGSGISSVVGNIGNRIESTINNIRTQIKSTIGATVQNLATRLFDGLKSAVTGFFGNLFNRGATA